MKPNRIHVYAQRHVFCDDDHLGLWHVPTATINLRHEFSHMADQVKAHFNMAHGIPLKITVGAADESFVQDKPLMDFPEELKAIMSPFLGDRTPELVDYARKNFPKDEFQRRYAGRLNEAAEEVVETTPEPVADEASPEPVKRGRKNGPAIKKLEDQQPDEE